MNIEKDKIYSIEDASQVLGISSYFVKRFIDRKILKANSLHEGVGKRYFIRGSWLISFKKKWESGTIKK